MHQTHKAPEYLGWDLDDACTASPEAWLGSFELREFQQFRKTNAVNAFWRKSAAALQESIASFEKAGQGPLRRGHPQQPKTTLRWSSPWLRAAQIEARNNGPP